MKWIHNSKMALAWAIVVELLVHGLFALQAFSLGSFLGELALNSIIGPSGKDIGAWTLAVFIFFAAFQRFVLGEYMFEHIKSYVYSGKGDQSHLSGWKELGYLVAGLELSSLAFRVFLALQQSNWVQAIIVLIFGLVALRYAYQQARVIHASVNRPVEYDIMQAQQHAGRTLAEKAVEYTRDMTPEQMARFVAGDPTAVAEVAQGKFFEEEQKRQSQDAKQQAKLTKQLDKDRREQDAIRDQQRAQQMGLNIFNPANWSKKHQHHQPIPGYPKLDPSTDFPEAQSSNQANHLSSKNGYRSNSN